MAGIILERLTHDAGANAHCRIRITLDGVEHIIETGNDEITAHEFNLPRFVLDALHYLVVVRGVPLAQAVGRVCFGEEATNVKVYPLVTKDITKTNVGTSYVNVAIGANGERKYVEFAGCTQFRIRLWANLVGTGPFGFRVVRDGDNEVLFENASIALTGERELDTEWQNLPAAFANQANGTLLRLQVKSTVAADDPVIRGCDLGVK